ncbi:MAG TPA: tetratricopeptide repeat protein [Fimbriimonadaceae bacterium]|nr:tetratricopeptide repeat protein [Fimbriimonadaceae bacterium]
MGKHRKGKRSTTPSAEDALTRARRLFQSGKAPEAARVAGEFLALNPDSSEALRIRGLALFHIGKTDEGLAELSRAIKFEPGSAQLQFDLGVALRLSGRTEESLAALTKSVDLAPDQPDFRAALGHVLIDVGRIDEAVSVLEPAVASHSKHCESLFHLANAYSPLGRRVESVRLLRRCVAADPGYVQAWNNLGNLLLELGVVGEAVDSLEEAARLAPRSPVVLSNLGAALNQAGKFERAVAVLLLALGIPGGLSVSVYYALGNALKELKKTDEALAAYDRALQLDTEFADARGTKAKLLHDLSRMEAARSALAGTSSPGLRLLRALQTPVIADSRDQMAEVRRRIVEEVREFAASGARIDDPLREVGMTNFYLAYHKDNEKPIQEEIVAAYLSACPELGFVAPHCEGGSRRSAGGRVRLGVISAFMRSHTIGKLYAPMLERLDRERIELVWVPLNSQRDEITESLRRRADEVAVVPLQWKAARDAIGALELDVAFFPEIGMDALTYYLAFSRFARHQFMTWGHPSTPCLPHIDAFVSCDDMEREGSEVEYGEKLIRQPALNTFFLRPARPEAFWPRERFGLPIDKRLYVVPQTLFKLHPDFDDAMAEILRRDPKGLYVLIAGKYPSWDEQYLKRFERTAPDVADRVAFVPQMSLEGYLSLAKTADAVLDPFYFGGGNSSLEMFAVGCPVATLPGDLQRGRITLAQYRSMEYGELIASRPEGFVEIALRLANDGDFQADARRTLEERAEILYEDERAVQQFEEYVVEVSTT